LFGPGSTITYVCRNMTMDQFVNSGVFRSAEIGRNPLNETGSKVAGASI